METKSKLKEEDVPFEVALHNLRYNAADAAENVLRAKKKALLVLIAAAIIFVCSGAYPAYTLFHSGRPLLCVLVLLAAVLLSAAAYFVSGQLFIGQGKTFIRLTFLYNGWHTAVEIMDEAEELQSLKKIYDKDIEKAEDRLISACEKLVNEYNKNSKE